MASYGREICFDTETTGLDPKTGDRIIEIGCVELVNRIKTGITYQVYINPQRDIPEASTKITGITNETVKNSPIFREAAKEFLEFIGDANLIAHNASFDMNFLNFELEENGFERIKNIKVIDTLEIARDKFPGSKNSLDALCNRFSIDLLKRQQEGHGALLDSELLADVYIELMGGNQSSIFIEGTKKTSNNEQNLINISDIAKNNKVLVARDFLPSSEDIEAHNQFITSCIKNSLWSQE